MNSSTLETLKYYKRQLLKNFKRHEIVHNILETLNKIKPAINIIKESKIIAVITLFIQFPGTLRKKVFDVIETWGIEIDDPTLYDLTGIELKKKTKKK